MTEKDNLKVTRGDAGHAFLNAPTDKKVCSVAGEEFGERQRRTVELIKSSCGTSTASRSFVLCLGDFIRTLGLVPTRADSDVWIKKDPNYEEHSCTSIHFDDFLIIGTDLEPTIESFNKRFITRDDEINPTSCLGFQWECSELGK